MGVFVYFAYLFVSVVVCVEFVVTNVIVYAICVYDQVITESAFSTCYLEDGTLHAGSCM